MDKETAFLQKINDRQVEAYRILYDEYYPALVVYASTFLASDEVAEDIVQELFVSMWEKRVTFVSFPAFKTYLYKFIKNSALNYLKHQGVEERYKEALQNNHSDEELDEEELDRENTGICFRLSTNYRPAAGKFSCYHSKEKKTKKSQKCYKYPQRLLKLKKSGL